MPEDQELLVQRLDRAHRRVEDAAPHSPDWDAAMGAIEDFERRLITAQTAAAAA